MRVLGIVPCADGVGLAVVENGTNSGTHFIAADPSDDSAPDIRLARVMCDLSIEMPDNLDVVAVGTTANRSRDTNLLLGITLACIGNLRGTAQDAIKLIVTAAPYRRTARRKPALRREEVAALLLARNVYDVEWNQHDTQAGKRRQETGR
ncbi:MAG: hypothetical protein ABIK37_03660 [candidate division WOR-3 bacterium]